MQFGLLLRNKKAKPDSSSPGCVRLSIRNEWFLWRKKFNAPFLNVWLSIFFNNVCYSGEMQLIHLNGKTEFLQRKPRVISNETLFVD